MEIPYAIRLDRQAAAGLSARDQAPTSASGPDLGLRQLSSAQRCDCPSLVRCPDTGGGKPAIASSALVPVADGRQPEPGRQGDPSCRAARLCRRVAAVAGIRYVAIPAELIGGDELMAHAQAGSGEKRMQLPARWREVKATPLCRPPTASGAERA